MRRVWLCLVILLTASACPPPVACPNGNQAPVRVELTEGSSPFEGEAEVSYVIDDDDSRACSLLGEPALGVYGCGTDKDGEYQITATVSGRESVTDTVAVVFEECRLETQTLSLEIGEACGDDDVPSVIVIVKDAADGEALEGAIVKYRVGSDSGGMQNCQVTNMANIFKCGNNEPGSIRVAVLKQGYVGIEESIEVSMGTCHVDTETLMVELETSE